MLYPLYTNKQINIPYLLKIGDGKVKKIGKYLADKNLTNAVIFWSEGIQRLLADRLYPGLEENGVKAVYEQDVRFINIEEITKITFSLPKAAEVSSARGGKALVLPNSALICSAALCSFRRPLPTTVFAVRILR